MRVISGSAKGLLLKFPKLSGGKKVRPLSDTAKESLFNILAGRINGCYFLDLFAGTVQVGIEALSRGADLAIFVEIDKRAVSVIRDNLSLTGLSDRAEIYLFDVMRAISVLNKKGAHFDMIFIGAPYSSPVLEPVLEKIAKSDIVKDSGIVIAECSKKQDLSGKYGVLEKFRKEKYGDTVFSFYKRRVEN